MSFGYIEKSKKGLPRFENQRNPYSSRDRQKWDGRRVQKLVVMRIEENEILEEEILEEYTSGIS